MTVQTTIEETMKQMGGAFRVKDLVEKQNKYEKSTVVAEFSKKFVKTGLVEKVSWGVYRVKPKKTFFVKPTTSVISQEPLSSAKAGRDIVLYITELQNLVVEMKNKIELLEEEKVIELKKTVNDQAMELQRRCMTIRSQQQDIENLKSIGNGKISKIEHDATILKLKKHYEEKLAQFHQRANDLNNENSNLKKRLNELNLEKTALEISQKKKEKQETVVLKDFSELKKAIRK